MQAIETKYLCPTNVRGSRYKAACQRVTITVSADDALNPEQNHIAAADALVARFIARDAARYISDTVKNPRARPFISGCLPSGNYCHVFVGGEK